MKKYQYLASWDDQTLTRVGEPVVVLGDSNVSQVEVILPSNFLLDPTGAVARMYFLLPGEKESGFETLETATKDENGDSHVTWTIKHVHSQKGGRLAFSLTLIGDDAQWDSRTAIIPVYESRYQPESEEAEKPYTGRLDALEGSMAAIRGEFTEVQEDFEELKETATLGTPIPESLVANMQEGHIYIYTGTEPGYTAGHVYYYVNGALTDGGVYGGTAVDATLTQSGKAADAKKTGDEISAIKEDLNAKHDAIENLAERVSSISPSETVSGPLVNFEADKTNAITSVTLDSESETATIVRCGKNLLPSDGTTPLSPDVLTVIKNDDGSLTINGTSPGGVTMAKYTVSLAAPIPSGTYYVNFEEISGTASSALGFRVLNSSGRQVVGEQGPGSATFTDDVGTVFFFIGAKGDTYSNYTIRMMLCEASLEDRSYVPYDGESYSVSNPLTFKDISGMSLLTGTNYIYSDAMSMSVKYSTNINGTIEAIRNDLGENSSLAAEYSASSTYAVGTYVLYDGTIYQCNTPITIAEAWTAAHWTAKDVSSVLADANARLDMLVTMQEIQEDEPVEGIVQLVDLSKLNWTANSQGKYSGKLTDYINLKGDGDYYQNPCGVTINTDGRWRLIYAKFYDAYNNQLTLTNVKNGSTSQFLTMFGSPENNGHFTIENGRTLKYYQGNTLTNTYTTEADIAKIMGNADFQTFDNDTTKFGITYGGKSASYVPYEGSAEPTYEYNYVPKMAEYVEEYMKAHGAAVDNNIFNYVYPEADNTEFVNAIKYYHSRKERENNNIIRIGTFNKYVSRGSTNYPVIKQELADYSVDMCGFQETDLTISDGVITNRIETALRGWQFPHGCDVSINTGKGFVSHWEILSSEALELLTTSRGVSYAIKCVVQLPEYKMYSNVINNKPTLSVYTYHGIAYNAEVDGAMTTSKQIRLMEISALLNFISEDTSDFIVIVGDTNAFESGFDIHTGTHEEWELFRQAGYTPVFSGEYSTVTADLADKYFTLADNNKVYCIAAYDQIFIGQNISVVETNVVDSNLYPVEALSGAPVSDHCMVYADLKFDFDAVMQNKLKDIAVTEPWW